MKIRTTLLLTISLLLGILYSYPLTAGWMVNKLDRNNSFTAIDFVDSKTGWAVGQGGCIIKTTDGGVNWTGLPTGFNDDLTDVDFINETTGCAISKNGKVLRTSNGGASWSINIVTPYMLEAIKFSDQNTGWITGEYAQILKTTDGGISWNISKKTGQNGDFYDISSIGSLKAWAGGQDMMVKTTDGGATWQTINESHIDHVFFVDEQTGWTSDYSSCLQITTDGGITWFPQQTNTSLNIDDFYFVDNNYGWAICNDGEFGAGIINTTDGGNTWNVQYSTYSGLMFQCLHFVDKNYGFIGGWASPSLNEMYDISMTYIDNNAEVNENADQSGLLSISCYPNPVIDNSVISVDYPGIKNGIAMINVFDIYGRWIENIDNLMLNSNGKLTTMLDASKLNAGLYIICVNVNGAVAKEKVLIVK
jgi:photosystem II stability/assembly factor-like uncharacterized protein